MGTFADSLFTVLMGWVRGLVNAIWALFTSDHTTVLEFFGRNWLAIAAVIIGAGLVIDWMIWLLRWGCLRPMLAILNGAAAMPVWKLWWPSVNSWRYRWIS